MKWRFASATVVFEKRGITDLIVKIGTCSYTAGEDLLVGKAKGYAIGSLGGPRVLFCESFCNYLSMTSCNLPHEPLS